MILVSLDDEEIRAIREQVSSLTFEYDREHDILIMPIIKNIDHFNEWPGACPFYHNVKKDGIELPQQERVRKKQKGSIQIFVG